MGVRSTAKMPPITTASVASSTKKRLRPDQSMSLDNMEGLVTGVSCQRLDAGDNPLTQLTLNKFHRDLGTRRK